jgi:hypothetical protein
MGPQSARWRSMTATSSKPQIGGYNDIFRLQKPCVRLYCTAQQYTTLFNQFGLNRPGVASHDMTTNMRHFSISTLSQPLPVYIPTRLAKGIPTRRRQTNTKQRATQARSEHARQSQPSLRDDPAMHRKDLDFIASLFTVEQLERERSLNS